MYVSNYVLVIGFVICLKLSILLSIKSDEYSIHSYTLKTNMTLKYISKGIGSFYRLYFKAFEVNYSLSLYQDDSVYSSTTKVFIYQLDQVRSYYLRNSPAAHVYIGTANISSDLSVFGYYSNGIVFGRIDMNDEVIYVEPFADKQPSDQREKVFEVISLSEYEKGNQDQKEDQVWRKAYKHYNNFNPVSRNPTVSIRNVLSIRPQWICSLELLVDHTYHTNRSLETVIAEMLFYAMNVNLVFRSLDLDKNRKLDGIRFVIEKITIFEYEDSLRNPVKIDTNDDTKFLRHLSRYRHPYCMLICFCSRDFRMESSRKGGRVCHEVPNLENRNYFSSNVGFVTDIENTNYIPRFITVSNLLYQLGLALGCKDDQKTDSICSPGDLYDSRQNYIMYSLKEQKANNWKFSSCCQDDMIQFLDTKANGLNKTLKSLCNNVTEEAKSHNSQPSLRYAKTCSDIKNITGCVPGLTVCCNETCDIISREENKTCYSNRTCYNASSVCDGVSPFCPEVLEPNGTLCLGVGICSLGECIVDICKMHNLEPCKCLSREEVCHTCCNTKFNNCQTAESLKLVSVEESLLQMQGTRCFNDQGICSSNGTCEINEDMIKQVLKYTNEIYYLILIPVILGIIKIATLLHHNYIEITPSFEDQLLSQRISLK